MDAKKVAVAKPNSFKLAELAHNTWFGTAEFGVTIDDVRSPDYWVHHYNTVKVDDHIQVQAKDDSFFVWLRVVGVTNTGVFVSELMSRIGTPEVVQPSEDSFRVDGPAGEDKWRIIRNADGTVVSKGFPNEGLARAAMKKMIEKAAESSRNEVVVPKG